MWHLMVFEDPGRTTPVKVMSFETVRQVAYVVGMPTSTVFNFFHNLIHARGSLRYVALFKD